jgi:nicotinamide mononucleotide adenylyltransferase
MSSTSQTLADGAGSRPETSPRPDQPELKTVPEYRFPTHKLRRSSLKEGKTPLALVACGSFSPVTFLHLRMFEMAYDFVRFNTEYVHPPSGRTT